MHTRTCTHIMIINLLSSTMKDSKKIPKADELCTCLGQVSVTYSSGWKGEEAHSLSEDKLHHQRRMEKRKAKKTYSRVNDYPAAVTLLISLHWKILLPWEGFVKNKWRLGIYFLENKWKLSPQKVLLCILVYVLVLKWTRCL